MRNLLTLLVLLPLFTFGQEINTQKDSSYTAPTSQPVYDDGLTMQQRGNRDAFRYYEGYRGARTGTLVTTLIAGGIAGLIPAIACSSTPPKEKNLYYPDEHLINNPDYRQAYVNRAKKIKQGKVWGGYGIGLGITIGLALLISAASAH